jgi:hypothetical protein
VPNLRARADRDERASVHVLSLSPFSERSAISKVSGAARAGVRGVYTNSKLKTQKSKKDLGSEESF